MMSNRGTIPKFASFKPKPATDEKGIDSKHESGSRERHSRDREDRRHHHKRHRSRSEEKERSHHSNRPVPKPPTTTDKGRDLIFVVDRKGDWQNIVYNSVYRAAVPSFHRAGAGGVLGAGRGNKIDRTYNDTNGLVLGPRGVFQGHKEKYAFSRNEKKPPRLLRIRQANEVEDVFAKNVDFMTFQPSRKRKRSGSNGTSSSDEKGHYRSIEGKMKVPTKPTDDAFEYATDSDSSGSDSGRIIKFNEAMKQKTVELSRKVDEQPEDIQGWLDLIEHQESLLGLGDTGYRKITNAERMSAADIKIHMYEKAIEKAGASPTNRERLILGLMKEGSKIWDFKTQWQKWEKFLLENLYSLALWKHYLDFRQSAFQTFRYEEVRDLYLKRIKLLAEAVNAKSGLELDKSALYEQLIYTVLRATLFMREAGYPEIGVAVWQALLEFNFQAPKSDLSTSSRLEHFKDFWESEVPRIGEEGANGWRAFVPDRDANLEDGRADGEIPASILEKTDVLKAWASSELFRAGTSYRPARTIDDVAEDDPYRVILWSDLEGFIIDLTSECKDLHWLLLDAFLLFNRLPPLPTTAKTASREWWTDVYVRDHIMEWNRSLISHEFKFVHDDTPAQITMGESFDQDSSDFRPFDEHIASYAGDLESMIPLPQSPTYLFPCNKISESEVASDTIEPFTFRWIQNTLLSLLKGEPDDNVAEYYLGLHWANDPQTIKKAAKSLLKERPSSLRLYNAYALLEWLKGNKDVSKSVFDAAFSMRNSLSESERMNAVLLCKTRALCFLNDGDKSACLESILQIGEASAKASETYEIPSPALMLKARNDLSSLRDYSLSAGDFRKALNCTECLALLEYLTARSGETISNNQGNVDAALAVFDKFSANLTRRHQNDRSIYHELSYQAVTRLLSYHIKSGPFRPALIRDRLTKYLTSFPRNTIFLSLYSWNERRLRIDDRVRTMLRDVVLVESADNIVSRLFAIRYESRTGNVHSIRAAFENAVSSPVTSSNPGLWKLYLLFCTNNIEYRGKAKDVFYRGMRACPWSKSVMMLAFTELRELMSFEELRSIFRVLNEKELRVHVDLEERLQDE